MGPGVRRERARRVRHGGAGHARAQHRAGAPDGRPQELAEILDARWEELGLRPGWPATQLRTRAGEMVRRLGELQRAQEAPVAVEQGFDVVVGRARLRGSMDRIDRQGDGLVVTDYKTGASVPSIPDAQVDPQLAAYQVAVAAGGTAAVDTAAGEHPAGAAPGDAGPDPLRARGARLVYLARGSRGATVREQPPVESWGDPGWAAAMVDQAAQIMASAQFWATPNKGCETCGVRRSCPAREEGRRLVPPRAPGRDRDLGRAPVSDYATPQARRERAWPERATDDSTGAGAREDQA